MLKLIYDVKCGFKDLYVKENNVEEDLTSYIEMLNNSMLEHADEIRQTDSDCNQEPFTEEELYEQYKDDPEALMDNVFTGTLEMIWEATILEYAKTYFKHICYADPKKAFIPDYCEITNLRLALEDEATTNPIEREESLKANEVMALLNISRPTLCHYVKRGLIKIDTNYTGKQYRYNKESVLALMKKK